MRALGQRSALAGPQAMPFTLRCGPSFSGLHEPVIVWDEPKRQANLLKHGLDFADFETSFDGASSVFLPTWPSRTGRTRYKILGRWQGRVVVVVIVSPLGSEGIALVSLRHANPKERAVYEKLRP